MPTKTYSLKASTIEAINDLAEKTVRTQGAIIDIAVADLAAKSVAADGGVDLPVVTLPARIRNPRKMTGRKKMPVITGVSRGPKGLVN